MCFSLLPVAGAAEAAADEKPAAEEELVEIVVTGSRIRRTTDYTTAVPTTVIDQDTMENAGIINVGDVLALTPSNISNFSPATTGMSSFNTGSYVPNLRGLNPFFGSRTLTLVNGQRPVSTSTLDSFDLNFIPQVLVSRIDSVTGGGSASYGSGAVAGAINIILDRQLKGGRVAADTSAAFADNDAKSNHVALAYGDGLFDNRAHFVIGAEWQKQNSARCQTSGRAWCSANRGPYQTSTILESGLGTASTALQQVGYGLTSNVNTYGVYAPTIFNATNFTYSTTTSNFASATANGLGTQAFNANSSRYLGSAPGGDGTLANEYANLMTNVERKTVTALFTADINEDTKVNLDVTWGKVKALNPLSNFQITTGTTLGFDNPYLQAITGKDAATLQAEANAAAAAAAGPPFFVGDSPGYSVSKDWNEQIPDIQFNNTNVKQVSLGVEGSIPGTTSWTWEAKALYGKTDNLQGSNYEPSVLGFSMAMDSTAGGCRVNQGLNAAYLSALSAYGGGGSGAFFPGGPGSGTGLPLWARVYRSLISGQDQISPVTGLTETQTLELLSQGCQSLNPFGNQALGANAVSYATSPLTLDLTQKTKSFNLNASGEFSEGIGAGPFSLALGYEWHKQVTDNVFGTCPDAKNTLGNANLTQEQRECLAKVTDLAYQYGNDYGGSSTFHELYAELNLPLLKGVPGANLLGLNLAVRDSFYENKAEYGVNVVPGSKNDGSLWTWKGSVVWDPLDGVRFRGTRSHDSRAPNPRDLYYSQTFVPGGPFGGFCFTADFSTSSPVCFVSLVGNINLKPETADTTALGLVFTPSQLPGFEASADWFYLKIKDAIQGGDAFTPLFGCIGGGSCDAIRFDSNYYEPGTFPPGVPRDVSSTPKEGYLTGEAAYRLGNVANILGLDGPAYNGGVTKTSGVDFSLSYSTTLPGGSKLSARALTTWVTKQLVQNNVDGVVTDALGAIGGAGLFLPNFQPAAKWSGNVSVNWNIGNFNVTPNMRWVGKGTLSNTALSCTTADFGNTSSLCNWVANSYYASGHPDGSPQTDAEAEAQQRAYTLLPAGVKNKVGTYFLFGLNASYSLNNKLPGVDSLQLWGQINNLFDRDPPFVNTTTTAAAFYDQLGRTYRVGFRLNF